MPSAQASTGAVRVALTAIFAVDGAVFANWVSRLPEVRETVGGSGALGLVLLGIAVGALPTMLITGVVCRRWRPVRVATATLLGMGVALTVLGQIRQPIALFVVLVIFGICYGATDVAMNSAAVELAADVGRPIVPALHGAYSLGGLVGAAGGALAAGTGVSVRDHLLISGVFGMLVVAALVLRVFPGAPEPRPPAVQSRPGEPGTGVRVGVIVGLGAVLTGTSAFGEGTVANWSGIQLVTVGGAPLWLAPFGYGVLSLTETACRLVGPRLIERLGLRWVGTVGATMAALGFGLALVPVPAVSLLGYAIAGAGLANLFPLGIAQAGSAAGSVGVSRAATVGYSGFLFGPPLIGLVAAQTGLIPALVLPVVALALAAVLARSLPSRAR